MNRAIKKVVFLSFISIAGCSSHQLASPDWVHQSSAVFESDGKVFFRTESSMVNQTEPTECLAKAADKSKVRAKVLQKINADVMAASSYAATASDSDLPETLDDISQEDERYEKSQVEKVAKIDCFVLSSMSKSAYDRMKYNVLYKFKSVDSATSDVIKGKIKLELFPSNSSQSKPRSK